MASKIRQFYDKFAFVEKRSQKSFSKLFILSLSLSLMFFVFHYKFTDFLLLFFRYMLYPILCCFFSQLESFFLEKRSRQAPTINRAHLLASSLPLTLSLTVSHNNISPQLWRSERGKENKFPLVTRVKTITKSYGAMMKVKPQIKASILILKAFLKGFSHF